MNKISAILIILAAFGIIWPALGQADIAYLSNSNNNFSELLECLYMLEQSCLDSSIDFAAKAFGREASHLGLSAICAYQP